MLQSKPFLDDVYLLLNKVLGVDRQELLQRIELVYELLLLPFLQLL